MSKLHFLDLDEAREILLTELKIEVSDTQMKRAAEPDAEGKRKLPFIVDPIDGRLKIDKNILVSIYLNRQAEAQNNMRITI